MSFELVGTKDDLTLPPGGPPKRRRREDGEETLELNNDVINCIELLEDVKIAYDLPRYAKYKDVRDMIKSLPNIKEEADEWFFENNSVMRGYETHSYDAFATFARILCDVRYIKGYGDYGILSYDDRMRLFRILWDEKIDMTIALTDYDDDYRSDIKSQSNQKLPGNFDGALVNIFEGVIYRQDIQRTGEELLFDRIRAFNLIFGLFEK